MIDGGMQIHVRRHALAVALILGMGWPLAAGAQEIKSAAPAKELVDLVTARKIDSIAARMPGSTDEFVGALVFPNQLVVVWAKTTAPTVLREKLLRHEYRDVYIDLNSASVAESRHFVTDLGADGLKPKPDSKSGPADSNDVGKTSMRFDGNWKEDKMKEADYMKAHAEADEAYATALGALIAELKKPS